MIYIYPKVFRLSMLIYCSDGSNGGGGGKPDGVKILGFLMIFFAQEASLFDSSHWKLVYDL